MLFLLFKLHEYGCIPAHVDNQQKGAPETADRHAAYIDCLLVQHV